MSAQQQQDLTKDIISALETTLENDINKRQNGEYYIKQVGKITY